jgi:polyribonucleotide nucleotidyltransferase
MTTIEGEVGSKKVVIETGLMAKQADGSTVTKIGDSVVLSTAVAESKGREGIDFFPLTVDYLEKTYAPRALCRFFPSGTKMSPTCWE